jgi:hypothetical protein
MMSCPALHCMLFLCSLLVAWGGNIGYPVLAAHDPRTRSSLFFLSVGSCFLLPPNRMFERTHFSALLKKFRAHIPLCGIV